MNLRIRRENSERASRTAELQKSNEELRSALERIQRLEKIVRMCAWTNRLELDGEWLEIEAFLNRRFGVTVTHGISEEALEQQIKDLGRE